MNHADKCWVGHLVDERALGGRWAAARSVNDGCWAGAGWIKHYGMDNGRVLGGFYITPRKYALFGI